MISGSKESYIPPITNVERYLIIIPKLEEDYFSGLVS